MLGDASHLDSGLRSPKLARQYSIDSTPGQSTSQDLLGVSLVANSGQPPRGVPWVSGLVGHFVQTWPDSKLLSHSAVLRL